MVSGNHEAPALSTTYRLDERLPPAAIAAPGGGFASYRNYPVFGLPWLLRRTALFGSFAVALGILSGAGNGLASIDWSSGQLNAIFTAGKWDAAVGIMAYSSFAFFIMVAIGPAMATVVRYLRFSQPLERVLVAGAILLGLVLSYLVDAWASDAVLVLGNFDIPKRSGPPPPAPIGEIFGVLFLCAIYFFLGGGLATKAYLTEVDRWAETQRQLEMSSLSEQKSASDLRLAVLQAQVEPHFLFNTLASVKSLVRQEPQRSLERLSAGNNSSTAHPGWSCLCHTGSTTRYCRKLPQAHAGEDGIQTVILHRRRTRFA